MERFVRDDAGYLAWLAAHPQGYVLNTYAHVTSVCLLLHRASCRTVNRPLAPGRTWTAAYPKVCGDARDELERWALEQAGKPAQPCGHCLAADHGDRPTGTPRLLGGGGQGPRAPRVPIREVSFDGEPIRLVIPPDPRDAPDMPPLIIEGAQWLAETFFLRDPSALGPGSFDAWIAASMADPTLRDRIIDADVTAVNRTMAAHAYHDAWAPIVAAPEPAWLVAIDPDWRLFELTDDEWAGYGVPARLHEAFAAILRPHLKIAVVTKVLHIKRPGLIPVLDSIVMEQIGSRASDDVASWVRAIEHLRSVGRANLAELYAIREHLESRDIHGRTLVRILDALLWTSSPGSGLFRQLAAWERVIRPRTEA